MRILLSAASCSPYRGSEPAIGWKVASTLALDHEVHALVFRYHEEELTRAQTAGLVPRNLHFHYVGDLWEESQNALIRKLQHWHHYLKHIRKVRQVAIKLIKTYDFDVIHHITFASWRLPVPLNGLGVPYVWGPVGGAEHFPLSMFGVLSFSGKAFELLRYASNLSAKLSPRLRRMIRDCDAVVASHPEVTNLLVKLRGSHAGVHELLVTAFTKSERAALAGLTKPRRARNQPIRAFCGGMLEGRKGVSLAVRAIALAVDQGVKIEYRISAIGPELPYLRKLVDSLRLGKHVIFQEPVRGEEYIQNLIESDVYLLPSLRDNAPITLMEAMLAGCVPVVADCGGPAAIVSKDCGYRLPVRSPGSLITALSETLCALYRDPDLCEKLGSKARNRILEKYTMEQYMTVTNQIYNEVILNRVKLLHNHVN